MLTSASLDHSLPYQGHLLLPPVLLIAAGQSVGRFCCGILSGNTKIDLLIVFTSFGQYKAINDQHGSNTITHSYITYNS